MNREANELPPPLTFTGERFVPGVKGEIWIEHWHRYHFAARSVAGKRVLDVACGEGYGAALLAESAAHVTGADLSSAAIAHAKAAYAAIANLDFVCAPCTELPLAAATIDVAVSFETIEHIAKQTEFLEELARVLTPEGLIILSCPNKLEYSDKRGFANEFHVKELYRDELAALVAKRFAHSVWYGQRPSFFSVIAPEQPRSSIAPGRASPQGEFMEIEEERAAKATDTLSNPLYFVVVASRQSASLEALAPRLSVLADRADWVHRDYEKVMRELESTAARAAALDRDLAQREHSIASLQQELRALQQRLVELSASAVQSKTQIAARDATIAARDAELAQREAEITRRRGWIWWLKLPLVRLGLTK